MLLQALPPALPPGGVESSDVLQTLALRTVLRSPEWGQVKGYWNLLNRVGGEGDRFQPAGDLDMAKADSIIADVRRCVAELNPGGEKGGMWSALEMTGLLVETRAMRLSRINPAFLTRMVPAWSTTFGEDLLYSFDSRLRELSRLRSAGELTEEVFLSASDTLSRQFETWALLQLADDRYGFGPPGIQERLLEVELLYETVAEEFGEDRVNTFREMRPYLEPLLESLLEEFY
ncbi:MAG: hypothetical protein R6V62_05265 [Candidatus Fermentibacteraceae bacterium]